MADGFFSFFAFGLGGLARSFRKKISLISITIHKVVLGGFVLTPYFKAIFSFYGSIKISLTQNNRKQHKTYRPKKKLNA